MLYKNRLLAIVIFSISLQATCHAKQADDEHIRQIVQSVLKEKDQKIEQLESRIRQLESERQSMDAKAAVPDHPQSEPEAATHTANAEQTDSSEPHKADPEKAHTEITSKIAELGKKVEALKTAAEDKGLVISGFFDVNAKTGNPTDQTFSVGSVELDLDYSYDDHYGASSALVLCGNSSNTSYAAPVSISCGNSGPGGLSGGGTAAGFAVALVDYHFFDNRIPPRGRIFNNNGLHIQAGRFDLPFGTDYQNFANKDRITVSAPLTTTRMQLGGFNGDGIRSYGSNGLFNYSVFWTDAMYANDGHSVGGRLGLMLGHNPYRIHSSSQDGFELGISHLSDLNRTNHIRNSIYGADLTAGYGMFRLQNEIMYIRSRTANSDQNGTWPLLQNYTTSTPNDPFGTGLGDQNNPLGKNHQFGFHSTLTANLEDYIHHPVVAFARYARWLPSQRHSFDYDGLTVVPIQNVTMLSLGFNYKFSDHMRFKFEYNDSLGSWTGEHFFDRKLGIAQMVMSF